MKKHLSPINLDVMITDFCNQNCPFCFAREEMKSPLKKEMSFKDFKMIVKKHRESGGLTISLIGGEPTIHPKFNQFLEYSLKYFPRVFIATNGLFSYEVEKMLLKYGYRITLFINISTPGFIFNKKIRKNVLQHIRTLKSSTEIVLVVINKFLNSKDAINIINLIDRELFKYITVRLIVEGVVAGTKNYITIDEFPKIGKNFFKVFKYVEKQKPKSIQIIKSSIFPCMFTSQQRRYLKQKGFLKIFHCHPKFGERSFFITPALIAFKCYPLSTRDRLKITKKTDFKKIREYYQSLQDEYHKKYILPKCKRCPFWGLEEGKCPGPCLGFKINALTNF